MKPYNGYKAEAPKRREALPAGGYVARIMDAEEHSYDWGQVLLISFDVTEGEHKDFFANDYRAQPQEDKKWRGTFRLRIPKDDGSTQDGWSKRSFNNAMWAVEASNDGYHWDWNEAGLKGKAVGALFRDKQWEMNGRSGWTTECCAFDSVENIRSGKFKTPNPKPLQKVAEPDYTPVANASSGDDLPF